MPRMSLPTYYIMSAVFAALLFVFTLFTNASITGFFSHVLSLGKFIPLALLLLSGIYYYNTRNSIDTSFTDTGLGFKIGKGLYYVTMLGCILLTFVLTLFGAGYTTGFLSICLDLMSVFAVVEGYFSYVNYQAYAEQPFVSTTTTTPTPPRPVL